MIEVTGNLWTYQPHTGKVDARVITTNGFVKKNGECVMGRGCAMEARDRNPAHGPDEWGISYPGLAKVLGNMITANGNHVYEMISRDAIRCPEYLFTFPVKHKWFEKADITLIERSAHELVAWLFPMRDVKTVVIPRPGCGNGQLNWADVKLVLDPILDDRFRVITF